MPRGNADRTSFRHALKNRGARGISIRGEWQAILRGYRERQNFIIIRGPDMHARVKGHAYAAVILHAVFRYSTRAATCKAADRRR